MTTKIPAELSSTPGIVDSSNATAITIDSSEEVGIGSTSPSAKLEVLGSSNSTYLKTGGDDSGTNARALTFTSASGTSLAGAVHIINAPSIQGQIAFQTNNGERARITGDGITFNGDTAAANALDDYEEGIHVATITCGTSGTVSLNGSYSDLSYTKVGRMVTVTGFIIVSSVSSPVGYYTISLPFTCANLTDRAADSCVNIMHHYGNNAKPSDIVAFLPESSSEIHVYRGDVGVTRSENSAEELRASTQIMLSLSYNVA